MFVGFSKEYMMYKLFNYFVYCIEVIVIWLVIIVAVYLGSETALENFTRVFKENHSVTVVSKYDGCYIEGE